MLNDKLIGKTYEKRTMYRGKDGRSYPTVETLMQADEAWRRRQNLRFIGKDGRFYSTSEELDAANRRYEPKKVIVYKTEK